MYILYFTLFLHLSQVNEHDIGLVTIGHTVCYNVLWRVSQQMVCCAIRNHTTIVHSLLRVRRSVVWGTLHCMNERCAWIRENGKQDSGNQWRALGGRFSMFNVLATYSYAVAVRRRGARISLGVQRSTWNYSTVTVVRKHTP